MRYSSAKVFGHICADDDVPIGGAKRVRWPGMEADSLRRLAFGAGSAFGWSLRPDCMHHQLVIYPPRRRTSH